MRNDFPKATTVTGAGIKTLTQQGATCHPHVNTETGTEHEATSAHLLGVWETALLFSVCPHVGTAGPQYNSVGSQMGKC